jgi:hypothetical protein
VILNWRGREGKTGRGLFKRLPNLRERSTDDRSSGQFVKPVLAGGRGSVEHRFSNGGGGDCRRRRRRRIGGVDSAV